MTETFETMIQKERERLTKQRDDALERRKKIDDEIAAIDIEFEAIRAYEGVKTGKAQKGTAASKGTGGKRALRGSRQQEVLDLIGQHPDGLTRREILAELGVKGNKRAEASVSNALNVMKGNDRIGYRDKRYYVSA